MIAIAVPNDTMDVRDLQVFLSVAKHLNFTRAGEEVHLSQPSVSVRIRQLEHDLGSKLFEHLGKKVALTEAGHLLIPYATRVIAAMDDARHAIDELKGLERGTLRIGVSTTPGMYLIPRTIAQFKRRYPKIGVHLAVKDTRQIELSREHHFDLYMLDSWLPDGSGFDLCKRLREFDPTIPMMFFSGAAFEADKATAINSGAQGYVIKPADLDVLCSEISKLIGMFPRKRELVEVPATCTSNVRRSSEDSAGLNFPLPITPRH